MASVISNMFEKAAAEDRSKKVTTAEVAEQMGSDNTGKKRGRPTATSRGVTVRDANVFIRCRVTEEENKKIKIYCAQNGITVDELIRRSVSYVLDK